MPALTDSALDDFKSADFLPIHRLLKMLLEANKVAISARWHGLVDQEYSVAEHRDDFVKEFNAMIKFYHNRMHAECPELLREGENALGLLLLETICHS